MWCQCILLAWVLFFSLRLKKTSVQSAMQDDILEWSCPKSICENFTVFQSIGNFAEVAAVKSPLKQMWDYRYKQWVEIRVLSLYIEELFFLQLPCPMLCLPLLCTNFTSSVVLWTDFTDYSGSKLPWSVGCQVFFYRPLKCRISCKDMIRTSDGTKKGLTNEGGDCSELLNHLGQYRKL